MSPTVAARPRPLRRLAVALPLAAFAVIGLMLALGLGRDPSTLPSALLGRPAPAFALPPLPGRDEVGFGRADLGGRPVLVNVFASWCVPCRIEHPILNRLAAQGVVVHAINYKDAPADAVAWLAELGDPFARVGSDRDGRAGIDWGVYGVPETYVVDAAGTIVHRHVGPLQPRDVEATILPLLERLAGG
jgi:cytochrome c biogenesis protein CcmG/thiol:disulfide interchange protein DsbE